jgi:hypothetical protein
MHCAALMIAVCVGLSMMIVRGFSSPEFSVWTGIFSLGVGGFLPTPQFKSH